MRKIVSMFLAMVMVFQLSVCCFADVNATSKVSNSLSISDCLNWDDFSANDHKLISGIISNPCEYLELSEIYNNMVVLIYKTNDYNTKMRLLAHV